ncbi:MAG: glycosyltransferase [Pseudomonadota bacterium]
MTVLQVVPELETGGVERTTVDIAAALVEAGDRAIVVSEGGRLLEELQRYGGEHITMPAATKRISGLRRNAHRLADLVEREGVDIIHARSRAPAWSAQVVAQQGDGVDGHDQLDRPVVRQLGTKQAVGPGALEDRRPVGGHARGDALVDPQQEPLR